MKDEAYDLFKEMLPNGENDIDSALSIVLDILNYAVPIKKTKTIFLQSYTIALSTADFTLERLKLHLEPYALHHFDDKGLEIFYNYLSRLKANKDKGPLNTLFQPAARYDLYEDLDAVVLKVFQEHDGESDADWEKRMQMFVNRNAFAPYKDELMKTINRHLGIEEDSSTNTMDTDDLSKDFFDLLDIED